MVFSPYKLQLSIATCKSKYVRKYVEKLWDVLPSCGYLNNDRILKSTNVLDLGASEVSFWESWDSS